MPGIAVSRASSPSSTPTLSSCTPCPPRGPLPASLSTPLVRRRGRGKFEASGITSARGLYWVAFDGMEAFGVVDEHMQFRDATSKLVGHIGDASQYEGITYRERTDTFFVTVEAVPVEQGRANQALVAAGQAPGRQLYSPQIHEVDISTEKESVSGSRVPCERHTWHDSPARVSLH